MNSFSALDAVLRRLFSDTKKKQKPELKRKLALESLEVREMLSVAPLSNPLDDTPPLYAPQSTQSQSAWAVEVETVRGEGKEGETPLEVDPMTPTGLHVAGRGSTSITCSWNAVEGASSYRLQRSVDDLTWTTAATTSQTSFQDWNRFVDDEFYYRVASIDADGNVSDFCTSIAGRRRVALDAPVLSIADRNEISMTMEWDAVENAADYYVWRSVDGGQTWTWSYTTALTQYIFTFPSQDGDVEYLFRAQANAAGAEYTSSARGNVVSTGNYVAPETIPSRPGGMKAESDDPDSIFVQWNSVPNASEYVLETALAENGSWTTLYRGGDAFYSHENIADDLFHYYRVRAVNDLGDSGLSRVAAAKRFEASADLAVPTGLAGTASRGNIGMELSWNPVAGAVSYRLEFSTNGSAWSYRNSTGTTFYLPALYPTDVGYYYRVASVDAQGTVSDYSDMIYRYTPVQTDIPEMVLTRTDRSIHLQWNPVENASTYTIQESRNGGVSWQNLAVQFHGTSLIHGISSSPDDTFHFRIRTMNVDDGYRPSDYGVMVSVKPENLPLPRPDRPAGLSVSATDATNISISWNSVQHASSYRLERRGDDGSWRTVYEGAETCFSDEYLDESTWYAYRVRAVNTSGESSPTLHVSVLTLPETASPVVFEIMRNGSGDVTEPLTVYYRLSGTAKPGVDYTISNGVYDADLDYGTITIPSGSLSSKLRLEIVEGATYNPDRSVFLTLLDGIPGSDDGLYDIGLSGTASASILSNERPPALWIESSHDAEAGVEDGRFILKRSNSQGVLTVSYELGGTAVSGVDYVSLSGTAFFADGSDTATIYVESLPGGSGTLILTLPPAEGDEYIPDENASATITILQTDAGDTPTTVRIEAVQSGMEDVQDGIVCFHRSETSGEMTIRFTLVETSTAFFGTDYTIAGAVKDGGCWTLTFQDGEQSATVQFVLEEDVVFDGPKTIDISIQESECYEIDGLEAISIFVFNKPLPLEKTDNKNVFQTDSGNTYQVEDSGDGLLSDAPSDARIELVAGPSNGMLTLNSDGTFLYTADEGYVGSDGFTYKTVFTDGTESQPLGVLIAVSPFQPEPIVEPGDDFENPAAVPVALDWIGSDDESFFVPTVVGTYNVTDTTSTASPKTLTPEEGDPIQGVLNEVLDVNIYVAEYGDGWHYTEIVTWNYVETYEGAVYSGGYEYVFTAWSNSDGDGFVFVSTTFDGYAIGASEDDIALQITGSATVLASMTMIADRSGDHFFYSDSVITSGGSMTTMVSNAAQLVSWETSDTTVTNTLRIEKVDDDVYETELGGTEFARIDYGGEGSSVSFDAADFEPDEDSPVPEEWSVGGYSMTTVFEYGGMESYSMEFSIVSREREVESENGTETTVETISLTGQYTAFANSEAWSVDGVTLVYVVSGDDESHSVEISVSESIESYDSSDWSSVLDADGEWVLDAGSSNSWGTIDSTTISNIVSRAALSESVETTDEENEETVTTSSSFDMTLTSYDKETSLETYEYSEHVVGGEWVMLSGTIGVGTDYLSRRTETMTGTSVVVDSEGASTWSVSSKSGGTSAGRTEIESTWDAVVEDWTLTGSWNDSSSGYDEQTMQLQQASYTRKIGGMAVSGSYGYTERAWSEYAFENEYSWIDEDWEQTAGEGWNMVGFEEGVGWNATGTFFRYFDAQTGSDGLTELVSADEQSGIESTMGFVSEWGFTSDSGGGAICRFTYENGEWTQVGEDENIASSSDIHGYTYTVSNDVGSVVHVESGGVESSVTTVVGYDAPWENRLWGSGNVTYHEWAVYAVAEGAVMTEGADTVFVGPGPGDMPTEPLEPGDAQPEFPADWFTNPDTGEELPPGTTTLPSNVFGGRTVSFTTVGNLWYTTYDYSYESESALLPTDWNVEDTGDLIAQHETTEKTIVLLSNFADSTAPLPNTTGSGEENPEEGDPEGDAPETPELEWKELSYSATTGSDRFASQRTEDPETGSFSVSTNRETDHWTEKGGFLFLYADDPSTTWSMPCGTGEKTSLVYWYQLENGYTTTVIGVDMTGSRTLTGFLQVKSEVLEDGSGRQISTDSRSEAIDVKADADNEYKSNDFIYEYYSTTLEQVAPEPAEGENGDGGETGENAEELVWRTTDGYGIQIGSRSWNYKYKREPVESSSCDSTYVTTRDGYGNYADFYAGTLSYDLEEETWSLTSGFGAGSGKTVDNMHTVSESLYESGDANGSHYVYRRHASEMTYKDENTFTVVLNVDDGAWSESASGTLVQTKNGTNTVRDLQRDYEGSVSDAPRYWVDYRTVKDTSYVDTISNIKTTIWSIGSDDAGLQSSHTGTNTTTREGYEKYDYESSCSNLDEPGVGGYQASRQEQRTYGGATLSYHYDSSGSGSYEWSGSITGSGSDVHVTDNLTSEKTYTCDFTYDTSGNRIMSASATFFFQWSGLEPVSGGSQTAYEGFWDGVSYDASRLPAYSFSGDSSFGSIADTEINVGFGFSNVPGMPSGPAVPEAINGLNFSPPSLTDVVCLPAWQRVNLADGVTKTIPELNVGDYVEVPDEDDPEGPKKRCRVVEIYHNDPQPILTLKFRTSNGEEFDVSSTPGHRYYVRNIGWQRASDIQPGNECRTAADDWAVLLSSELDPNPVSVYNFQVEGAHTYFVGDSAKLSVLTHNQDCAFFVGADPNVHENMKKAGKWAGDKVRAVGNWFAKANQNIADKPLNDSVTIAAIYGWSACLIGNLSEVAASTLDYGTTVESALSDVSQSIAVGREHGIDLGIARQFGILRICETIFGTDIITGEPVDPVDGTVEASLRLGGTVLTLSGTIKAGQAFTKQSPRLIRNPSRWPDNDGFLSDPRQYTLPEGYMIDRYGEPSGRFVSPQWEPFERRSLPSEFADKPLRTYEVNKDIPGVLQGEIAPAFDQTGGGLQFKLPKTIEMLLKDGSLIEK